MTTDCSMVIQFAMDPLQPFGNTSMNEPPEECAVLVGQHLTLLKHPDTVLFADNIGSFCVDYQKVADCLRALRSISEQRVQIALDATIGTWEFLCSDGGKLALKAHYQSPCYGNEEKMHAVKELVEVCANGTAQPNSEDQTSMCTYLRRYQQCVYNISKDECGESMAILSQGINLAYFRALPIHSACFPEHVVEIQSSKSVQK
ncbi:hypothetical protein BsWGS_23390 [Bradybaena similaris]